MILQQVASGKTQSPHRLTTYQYSTWTAAMSNPPPLLLSMNDTVQACRIRPTAYVIPKDIP
ncbi:MAG: hypothetical protein ACLUJG_08425 [Lawsonibacter sp.]